MGRKRKGIPLHGWLVLDKPLGISSSQAVGKARYFTKAQKVGHGGTLDPLASGVLPLAFGEATKLSQWAMDGTKTYEFTIQFGSTTSTDDLEGDTVETTTKIPQAFDIESNLEAFTGIIQQTPPAYSAIKIDGKRAYDLARAGETVEMKPREVIIHSLRLVDMPTDSSANMEVVCGKGTYVRSLARDIASACGSLGHVSALRRTRVGKFGLDSTILLEKLEKMVHIDASEVDWASVLLPVDAVLDDIPVLQLSFDQTQRVQHGQTIDVDVMPAVVHPIRVMHEGTLVAMGRQVGSQFIPERVFNY